MIYRCRTVVPKESPWYEMDGAASPGEAAHDFHYKFFHHLKGIRYFDEINVHAIYFAHIEVENHECFISRIYQHGLFRRGGVKSLRSSLKYIAEDLGWTKDPELLIAPGWELEESLDEARQRKYGGSSWTG